MSSHCVRREPMWLIMRKCWREQETLRKSAAHPSHGHCSWEQDRDQRRQAGARPRSLHEAGSRVCTRSALHPACHACLPSIPGPLGRVRSESFPFLRSAFLCRLSYFDSYSVFPSASTLLHVHVMSDKEIACISVTRWAYG